MRDWNGSTVAADTAETVDGIDVPRLGKRNGSQRSCLREDAPFEELGKGELCRGPGGLGRPKRTMGMMVGTGSGMVHDQHGHGKVGSRNGGTGTPYWDCGELTGMWSHLGGTLACRAGGGWDEGCVPGGERQRPCDEERRAGAALEGMLREIPRRVCASSPGGGGGVKSR